MTKTINILFPLNKIAVFIMTTATTFSVAQTTVEIKDVVGCYEQSVLVPVVAENLMDVAAITLYIKMDSVDVKFNEIRDINDAFSGGNFVSNQTDSVLSVTWFSTVAANIENGLMFNIDVTLKSDDILKLDILEESELVDSQLNIITDVEFGEGNIYNISLLQPLPANIEVVSGNTVNFALDLSEAEYENVQWQGFIDGQWLELQNDNTFSGVNTTELSIVTSEDLTGSQYRCYFSSDSYGCFTKESSLEVINPSGVEQSSGSSLSFFPNPTADYVNISITESIGKNGIINVFNVSGDLKMSKAYKSINGKIRIDVSGLSNGLYFIQLVGESGSGSFKIIRN
jgi:hypothetical protein